MSLLQAVYSFMIILTSVSGVVVFFYYQLRSRVNDYDQGTIKSLQNALLSREEEIKILHEQIVKQQAQITNQAKEIEDLRTNLHTLEHLVTAKDDILRIESSIEKFVYLIGDSGVISQFQQNDAAILGYLQDIKTLVTQKVVS